MCNFPDLSHPLAKASDEKVFSRLLTDLVSKYLSENPHASLADLTLWLPSVYPATLLKALKSKACRRYSLSKSVIGEAKTLNESSTLAGGPVPHPLDAEWRFTPQTTIELLQRMSRLSTRSTAWIGLGTPSIFKAKDDSHLKNKMILFDANPALGKLFRRHMETGTAIMCDLIADPIPSLAANLIVVDAPWYYEEMAAFLWVARQMCMLDGRVLLSTPKIGTRPGIGLELQRLTRWINELGFVIERFEPDAIKYDSPFFEKNALGAEGIFNFPSDWRRADLLTLRAKEITFAARPRLPKRRKSWQEVTLGAMRLRILVSNDHGFRDPALYSLTVKNRPTSVSRRDSRKEKAKIWTSGNRIFNCRGIHLLLPIAQAVASRRSACKAVEAIIGRPLKAAERVRVEMSVRQLRRLAQTESSELRAAENPTASDGRSRYLSRLPSDELQLQDSFTREVLGIPGDVGIHVAVFVKPFLNFILEGTKTVESRFSITRRAPFERVDIGDLILLKKSGGPIVGSCRVAEAWFYRIEPSSWSHIRREFTEAICAQGDEFWTARAHANYATLLRIEDVRRFAPITLLKKDRRGWVVVRPSQQRAIFSHND